MSTKVVFRKFRKDGQIIAYFPDSYVQEAPYVMSYMHLGQHGQASPYADRDTVLATPAEYADLYSELTAIYGELQVLKRIVRPFSKMEWNK